MTSPRNPGTINPNFVFGFSILLLTLLNHHTDSQESCSNTAYSKNLNQLISTFPSQVLSNKGFYNATIGKEPDKLYALALCRGDITIASPQTCYDCVNTTVQSIITQCPNPYETTVWGEVLSASRCMIRYSSSYIFGKMELGSTCVPNPNRVTQNAAQFNVTLYDLMMKLATQTSSSSSPIRFFATGGESYSGSSKVYGLVQCTPDISSVDCGTCLQNAIGQIEGCSGGMQGGRVLGPSCFIWYEVFQFYEKTSADIDVSFTPTSPTSTPPPPQAQKTGAKSKATQTVVIVVVVAVIVAVLLLAIITVTCVTFSKRRMKPSVTDNNDGSERPELRQFDLDTIRAATNDFGDNNKLGQGGFGPVYKGVLRDKTEVAVKRLSRYSSQGLEEFKNEISFVAKLQHRNLVRLLGFCSEGAERILVYEFLKNGSLDQFIFDPSKRAQMEWTTRCKIMIGVARGILYLHEDSRLRLIHRDLKPSNVLLDESMNPKISDFGMARMFGLDQTQATASKAGGTYGYMAPECALQHKFSVKSDVFSFGVIVLEVVCGKKNSWFTNSGELEHLLTNAWNHWRNESLLDLIDEELRDSSSLILSDATRCIHVGLLCVQEHPADRPDMNTVIQMLGKHCPSLPEPSRPGFFMNYNSGSDLPSFLESNSQERLLAGNTEDYIFSAVQ